jgi:hypothetical protein
VKAMTRRSFAATPSETGELLRKLPSRTDYESALAFRKQPSMTASPIPKHMLNSSQLY